MGQSADAKAYGDVLRILDHCLDYARRRHEAVAASQKGRSRGNAAISPQRSSASYQVWVGRQTRFAQFVFPTPNAYLDSGAISLLRSAYEIYKRDDLSSDLVAHLQTLARDAKSSADSVVPRFALSAVYWWDEDKDAALAEFARAVDATKSDPELTLSLAELYQQRGDLADALAKADAIQPVDNATMQRREELAMSLATRTGDTDRARLAAERLFGLRLDTDTQLRLSEQMHQLGMHETAEAVLARARRRVGNKATALVGLMLQYQRQNKNDIAAQVALQILRSSTASRPASTNVNIIDSDQPDAARSSAMQVLARSGKLAELIQRTEEQLQRTPGSSQLRITLADYYTAANQREKARDELTKLAQLRPDDLPLRLRVAASLAQQGQSAAAVEHYEAIFKKDPAVLARSFSQVLTAYRKANKTDQLIRTLEKADIRSFGQPLLLMNLIQNLMNDERNREAAVSLFKKAWEAFPADRPNLFRYVQRVELAQMPEMYGYAREALIPNEGSGTFTATQWNLFQQILSYSSDGTVTSLVSNLLDVAEKQNKTADLAADVEAAIKKFPTWTAGKAILALIRTREGKYAEAKELFKSILALKPEALGTYYADWIIGAELDRHTETRDLARTFFERTVSNRSENASVNYEIGPLKRLVSLYANDGRKNDARRILLEAAKPRELDGYDTEYQNQMRVQGLTTIGRQLIDLGFAADAMPLLNDAVEIADSIAPDGPNYIGSLPTIVLQTRNALDQGLKNLKDDQVVLTVLRLLNFARPPRKRGLETPRPERQFRDARLASRTR